MSSRRSSLLLVAVAALSWPRPGLADPAPPEEAAGLKWGISENEAKEVMKAKGASLAQGNNNTDKHLLFYGGTAGGLPVGWWDTRFGGDKFLRVILCFKDTSELETLFKQVKKALTEKYGTRQKESFKPELSAEWHLGDLNHPDGVTIHLFIHSKDHQKTLRLEYANDGLIKQFPAESKPKPENDSGL